MGWFISWSTSEWFTMWSTNARSLSYLSPSPLLPHRCKSIMNVARAKLDLIKPEEVNMDEYEVSRFPLDFLYLCWSCSAASKIRLHTVFISFAVVHDWTCENRLRFITKSRYAFCLSVTSVTRFGIKTTGISVKQPSSWWWAWSSSKRQSKTNTVLVPVSWSHSVWINHQPLSCTWL